MIPLVVGVLLGWAAPKVGRALRRELQETLADIATALDEAGAFDG